jgi:DNA-binding PadR family transcriptional regulator
MLDIQYPSDRQEHAAVNVTNLIVLGFLRMRPMHGYEIQQLIQQSRMDDWANLLSGSIYYALNKMEQDGLIRAEAEVRTGNRLRKIYAITEEGEAQFREMVRESLTVSPHSMKSDLALGLAWIDAVPREEAIRLLERNLEQVERTREQWLLGREIKGSLGLTPVVMAAFDNAIGVLELDIAYLKRLIALLREEQAG